MGHSKPKVVILGGGVGGTILANQLARAVDRVEVTVVDATGVHHYQPGLLYVPFGWERPERLRYDERSLLHPAIHLVQALVKGIDLDRRRLHLANDGELSYDFLVIATGCCPVPQEIPGLTEGSYHFYTEPAAVQLYQALHSFEGGRIVVGIASFPYKCPPAPLEFTLLLDDWLRQRNLRKRTEIVFVTPLPQVFSIPTAVPFFEEAFNRKGIKVETFFNTERIEPEQRRVISLEGTELDYDLLVMIPPHQGSPLVSASGLGDKGGWVPTDRHTLQVKGHERLFAIGDVTDLPVSKSGSAAHYQAHVLAHNLLRIVVGQEPDANYDGRVLCYVEAGDGKATKFYFNYENPPRPPRPSVRYKWIKSLLNRFYPAIVPKGFSLRPLLSTPQGLFTSREAFCGSTMWKSLQEQLQAYEKGEATISEA